MDAKGKADVLRCRPLLLQEDGGCIDMTRKRDLATSIRECASQSDENQVDTAKRTIMEKMMSCCTDEDGVRKVMPMCCPCGKRCVLAIKTFTTKNLTRKHF